MGFWSCAMVCDLGRSPQDLSWLLLTELLLGGMEVLSAGLIEIAMDGVLLAALGPRALVGLSAYVQAACSEDGFLAEL